MKCPATITGMVNALRLKYPHTKLIGINKNHDDYIHTEGVESTYWFYVAGVHSQTCKTRKYLKELVTEHLNK